MRRFLNSGSGADLSGNLHKLRQAVIEELLICRAEITLAAKVFLVQNSSILHAAAPADRKVPAEKAFVTEISLGPGKKPLLAVRGKLLDRRLQNIADTPSRFDKKIAAEGIAGMLDDNILTALSAECADRMRAGDII